MAIKKTTEQFITESNKIHNNYYVYDLVNYVNANTDVLIICPEHGEFLQKPRQHTRGSKCSKCNNHLKRKPIQQFINESNVIHNGKYHYLKTTYINNNTDIIIICPEHGEFLQKPKHHLNGSGCSECVGNKKLNINTFIKKSNIIHNKYYDYTLVKYKSKVELVEIICPKHGVFKQKPSNHLKGSGCQICNQSKGELLINNWLIENKIKFECQHKFDDCRNKLPLPFDFYLPEYNMCIEYDGEQHFIEKEYWGGAYELNQIKKRDEIKNKYCKDNGIKILRISYKNNIINKLKKINMKKNT